MHFLHLWASNCPGAVFLSCIHFPQFPIHRCLAFQPLGRFHTSHYIHFHFSHICHLWFYRQSSPFFCICLVSKVLTWPNVSGHSLPSLDFWADFFFSLKDWWQLRHCYQCISWKLDIITIPALQLDSQRKLTWALDKDLSSMAHTVLASGFITLSVPLLLKMFWVWQLSSLAHCYGSLSLNESWKT